MTASWAQRWQGRDRIVPAIAALLVNAVIGCALIIGLRAPSLLRYATDSTPLALFDLDLPQSEIQPEPPPREKEPPSDQEGGAQRALLHASRRLGINLRALLTSLPPNL